MKRALWATLVVAVLLASVYGVMTHEDVGRIEELEQKLEGLRAQNRSMLQQNERLRQKIEALRDDPRLAERQARSSAGLSRDGEVVYQFENADAVLAVDVPLRVDKVAIMLAGKQRVFTDLAQALIDLREQVPGAKVHVQFSQDVDAIARQKVVDVLEASEINWVQHEP
jgi:cell division protein FtsB